MTTKTRKPERSVKVTGRGADPQGRPTWTVLMTVDGVTDTYTVTRYGASEHTWAKWGGQSYYTAGGSCPSCECWGFLRYGRCRHLSATAALTRTGQLAPAAGCSCPRPCVTGTRERPVMKCSKCHGSCMNADATEPCPACDGLGTEPRRDAA